MHFPSHPEFVPLMKRDRSKWPRCWLWHGWLPGLSSLDQRDPWPASLGQLAERALESSLGAYPAGDAHLWVAPDLWDADDLALEMVDRPNIWTDGSREEYPVGGFEVAGSGVYFPAPEASLLGSVWGVSEEYGDELVDRCRAFMSVPGPLQSVQRAEFWGAIMALHAYYPCHLGIDNLNVARTVGRLLDHGSLSMPLPLVKDGDLVSIVLHMLNARRPDTVSFTKVKGHAAEADVDLGQVRLEDRLGNMEADAAADLGRRHQEEEKMDARRALLNARDFWYPIVCQLHRFMVAVSRVTVNHDGRGETAPDALVWDQGSIKKRRRVEGRVNVDLATLPGPPNFLQGSWMQVSSGDISW